MLPEYLLILFLLSGRMIAGVDHETGIASWYSERCNYGTATASGIPFDENKMTAAHKSLPFGTKVLVQDLDSGKSLTVTITDRGPFVEGRVIDLSKRAFKEIAPLKKGLVRVRLKVF